MTLWRALLIVYSQLDVHLGRRPHRKRYRHSATEREISDAVKSFNALPALAAKLSSGAVNIEQKTIMVERPLRSLTNDVADFYWPSPNDTRHELDEFAPMKSCDSVFIFWPQHDSKTGSSIACRGWGLGMGPAEGTHGATYAVVANAPSEAWKDEAPGEVWLHEWLHGVCQYFAGRGYSMPERDADGAEIHGYVRSPTEGWTEYYRDLMNGTVPEDKSSLGIPVAAWRESSPLAS